jgi:hypothetical protein
MGLIVIAALGFYLIIQKNPMKGYNTMKAAQTQMKPILNT